jgi:hypothetical protein
MQFICEEDGCRETVYTSCEFCGLDLCFDHLTRPHGEDVEERCEGMPKISG